MERLHDALDGRGEGRSPTGRLISNTRNPESEIWIPQPRTRHPEPTFPILACCGRQCSRVLRHAGTRLTLELEGTRNPEHISSSCSLLLSNLELSDTEI